VHALCHEQEFLKKFRRVFVFCHHWSLHCLQLCTGKTFVSEVHDSRTFSGFFFRKMKNVENANSRRVIFYEVDASPGPTSHLNALQANHHLTPPTPCLLRSPSRKTSSPTLRRRRSSRRTSTSRPSDHVIRPFFTTRLFGHGKKYPRRVLRAISHVLTRSLPSPRAQSQSQPREGR